MAEDLITKSMAARIEHESLSQFNRFIIISVILTIILAIAAKTSQPALFKAMWQTMKNNHEVTKSMIIFYNVGTIIAAMIAAVYSYFFWKNRQRMAYLEEKYKIDKSYKIELEED